jgi:hypothetical protein
MANKNILTYAAKVSAVEQDYYSPVAVLPITGIAISTIYAFIARVDPWAVDSNPEQPTQTQAYLKSVYKNIFALKEITSNNVSPVVPRINWVSGTVYAYYKDTIDMFSQDSYGNPILNFYIKNSYDQVFKCLWNNNGQTSTVMPFFQPGTYGTNNIFQGADNYKWKYMYTINSGTKKTFMDNTWMPVPVGENTEGPVFSINADKSPNFNNQIGAWAGDIEVINIINGGSGYSNTTLPTITITGDGAGATAYPVVSANGVITDIVVETPGQNYTYATVTITSLQGSGATVVAPISPVGGHGFDPVAELGCNHAMLTCEFNGSEGGYIPTDIQYRQVGFITNPTAKSSWPYPANNTIYNASTQVVVAPGFGSYNIDEVVFQGNPANPTFSGTLLNWNSSNNVISVINTTGSLAINSPIFGTNSGTTRTILSYSNPDILLPSGYISYIENRSAVQRSADGIEQVKFVLGY